jgi:uncharacterized protein YbaR (Trm112 family)
MSSMSSTPRPLDRHLMAIVRCPACLGTLTEGTELTCTECGLRYPVRNDIPVLLVDEALPSEGADTAGPTGN